MSATAANAVRRPPRRDLLLLAVGVVAISTSAPLIAATAAPALAIAFWRNAFGTVAMAPFALVLHHRELFSLSRRQWALAGTGGVLLALHFATWIPSLDYTSVASSTALVATQPAWAALIARWRGQLVPRRAWLGIGIAFAGALVISGVDFSLSASALFGDLLALVGAFFAAAYVTVGAEARRSTSTTVYTAIVYGVTSVVLLAVCLVLSQQLVGYTADTWSKLVLLTLGAQLLGHTVFNAVLKTTPPTVMSLAILFEMPGSALLAWVWLAQVPPRGVLPGAALLLAGITIVVRSGSSGSTQTVPPVE
ncbi:MAG: DMT family transporter [Actinomycetes bacterium]